LRSAEIRTAKNRLGLGRFCIAVRCVRFVIKSGGKPICRKKRLGLGRFFFPSQNEDQSHMFLLRPANPENTPKTNSEYSQLLEKLLISSRNVIFISESLPRASDGSCDLVPPRIREGHGRWELRFHFGLERGGGEGHGRCGAAAGAPPPHWAVN
jgi:hypothetical protein